MSPPKYRAYTISLIPDHRPGTGTAEGISPGTAGGIATDRPLISYRIIKIGIILIHSQRRVIEVAGKSEIGQLTIKRLDTVAGKNRFPRLVAEGQN